MHDPLWVVSPHLDAMFVEVSGCSIIFFRTLLGDSGSLRVPLKAFVDDHPDIDPLSVGFDQGLEHFVFNRVIELRFVSTHVHGHPDPFLC